MLDTELITTGQAAARLSVSRQHIVDLCQRGMLPYVTVGTHRRIRAQDVDALVDRALTRDQVRSWWLHHVVAAKLARDPQRILDRARANLREMQRAHPTGLITRWLDAWESIIDAGVFDVLEVLTSRAPLAVQLRQNSPFAGVLDESERYDALAAFRAQWRKRAAA